MEGPVAVAVVPSITVVESSIGLGRVENDTDNPILRNSDLLEDNQPSVGKLDTSGAMGLLGGEVKVEATSFAPPFDQFPNIVDLLTGEDMKSIEPGNFERHWGVFTYDGKPKFPMDLSGDGNDKLLVAAKGVQYLDNQWCVYDKNAGKQEALPSQLSWACSHADCSCLQKGSSCSDLDNNLRNSYAFNSYFQTNDQDVEACNFEGLAKIVSEDPTKGNCRFLIQIESAGERLSLRYGAIAALVSLVSFFMTLV